MRPLASAIVALALTIVGTRAMQQPFRSRTDLVLVDVAVLSHGSLVKDLTAADFEVRDNGVPQAPELVQGEMPVDLSVMAEVSPLQADSRAFWTSLDAIQRQLHPDDRIGVSTFTILIRQDVPLSAPPIDLSHEPVERGNEPRLYDAIARALMSPGSRVAGDLLVVYTDGRDIRSVLAPESVLSISRKSDARVIVVLSQLGERAHVFEPRKLNPLLKKLTDTTDGRVIKPIQLASTIAAILTQLREAYLLGFVPKGVDAKGWHTIAVKVTRPGGERYTVRARRGYFGG